MALGLAWVPDGEPFVDPLARALPPRDEDDVVFVAFGAGNHREDGVGLSARCLDTRKCTACVSSKDSDPCMPKTKAW